MTNEIDITLNQVSLILMVTKQIAERGKGGGKPFLKVSKMKTLR